MGKQEGGHYGGRQQRRQEQGFEQSVFVGGGIVFADVRLIQTHAQNQYAQACRRLHQYDASDVGGRKVPRQQRQGHYAQNRAAEGTCRVAEDFFCVHFKCSDGIGMLSNAV